METGQQQNRDLNGLDVDHHVRSFSLSLSCEAHFIPAKSNHWGWAWSSLVEGD